MAMRVLSLSSFSFGGIAASLFFLSACAQRPRTPDVPPALGAARFDKLVVVTSDRKTGGLLESVDLVGGRVERSVRPVHSDALARSFPGHDVAVVNRFGKDNLQFVSRDLTRSSPETQVGEKSNPSDVVIVGEFAYVSIGFGAGLIKYRRTADLNKTVTEVNRISLRIDNLLEKFPSLPKTSDPDGSSEPAWITRVGHRLLVQLQCLKNYEPTEHSYIAVIDTNTDQVESVWPLARTNPTTDFKRSLGKLYIGEMGAVGLGNKLDGAIEQIDEATLKSEGIVIDEKSLGGEILDFEILAEDRGIAILYEPTRSTTLVSFNPSTGKREELLLNPRDYSLKSLLWDEGRGLVYLADRDRTKPGIRIFDAMTLKERGEFRFTLALPPEQMFFLQ